MSFPLERLLSGEVGATLACVVFGIMSALLTQQSDITALLLSQGAESSILVVGILHCGVQITVEVSVDVCKATAQAARIFQNHIVSSCSLLGEASISSRSGIESPSLR